LCPDPTYKRRGASDTQQDPWFSSQRLWAEFETTNEIAENVFLYYNTRALTAVLRVHVVYVLLCANESVVHNGAC